MKMNVSAERKLVVLTIAVVTFILMSSFTNAFISTTPNQIFPTAAHSDNGRPLSSPSQLAQHMLTSFTVSISPLSSILDIGQSVTITATTSNQSLSYTYTWYLGGKPVVGTTSSKYLFTPPSPGGYIIYVNVTSEGKSAISSNASVTVDSAPSVSISPSSKTINVGQTLTLQSTVTGGTGNFTYRWYLNGTKTNVTTSSYTFTPTGNATYFFWVDVSDMGTSNGSPTTITNQSNTAQITAVLVKYQVIFQETGLPSGNKWYVNLTNGQSFPIVGSINLFYEPNGTYHYTIASGDRNYYPNPNSGLFVISGGSYSVAINFYPKLYQVSFVQLNNSKLPAGTYWYVNITGEPSLSSDSSIIIANLSNGSYTFTISTADKDYYPTPLLLSSFLVNGKSISVPIAFNLLTYEIEFTETGLPSGSSWSVTVNNSNSTQVSSTTQTISLTLPNGTYLYTVRSGISTYGPFPSNGTFKVSGLPVSIALLFLRIYEVSFYETGLPLSQPGNLTWYLNITDPQYYNSKTNTISFMEPNGTYTYNVSVNSEWYTLLPFETSRNFTVNGGPVSPYPSSSPLTFYKLFNVTISKQNLPPEYQWYINVTNGPSFSSNLSSISFTEINGSYNFTVSTGYKLYRPDPYRGSFSIVGDSIELTETFILVTYQVMFAETGLTNGTFWEITVNNNTRISTNGSIVFKLSNGSFEYSIQPLAGFSAVEYAGNVTVNGSSLVRQISWAMVTYELNVTQSGLSVGKKWSVTLEGKTFNGISIVATQNTTKSFLVFREPNGSYNYTLNAPFGYTGSHVTGKVVISGNSAAVVVTLVPPNFALIGIAGAVAVSLLAIALAFMIRHEKRSFFVRDGKYIRDGKYLRYKK